MMFEKRSEYREMQNILKTGLMSRVAIALYWELGLMLFRRVTLKGRFSNLKYYPLNVRKIADSLEEPGQQHVEKHINLIHNGPRKLKLANGYIEFDLEPNWHQLFEEHEQFVSLHRWNWLLFALTEPQNTVCAQWGESLIRSWLSGMTPLPSGFASHSYTIGERISNASLFFRHINGHWDGVAEDIASALHVMALHLSKRIEYYPGELSGNHVINNSRAILFAGYCCKDQELILLGKAVLQNHLPKMVDSYGFLREGSSHYQFLFTRWILEIRMLALEVGDTELSKIIQPFIPEILNACNLLLVENSAGNLSMPTIGDVSPDCDPKWLLHLLHSPLAGLGRHNKNTEGWASLFSNYKYGRTSACLSYEWPSHHESSWVRIDFEGWTAIWHIEGSNGPVIASHSHHDFTSFVLFLDGEEILIDIGRYSYNADLMGTHGVEACAHNTIQLDGFPPMLSTRDKALPSVYKNSTYSVNFSENVDSVRFVVKHNGFSRISNAPILHTREFRLIYKNCEINDYIEGEGSHFFESFLHWPMNNEKEKTGNISISNNVGVSFDLIEYTNKVDVDYSNSICDSPVGWRFPAYFKQVPCITQRFYGDIVLPLKLSFKITRK